MNPYSRYDHRLVSKMYQKPINEDWRKEFSRIIYKQCLESLIIKYTEMIFQERPSLP